MNTAPAIAFGAPCWSSFLDRQLDYTTAKYAIARGRAALAEPLPAPRCDDVVTMTSRAVRAARFLLAHKRRGGRWS